MNGFRRSVSAATAAASSISRRARCVTAAAVTALLLMTLAGCSDAIVGRWRMIEALPNKQTFSIERATFRRDGTFDAVSTLEGKRIEEKGSFEFTGFSLVLRPSAGGQRKWQALLRMDELEVTNGKSKVVLKKE